MSGGIASLPIWSNKATWKKQTQIFIAKVEQLLCNFEIGDYSFRLIRNKAIYHVSDLSIQETCAFNFKLQKSSLIKDIEVISLFKH